MRHVARTFVRRSSLRHGNPLFAQDQPEAPARGPRTMRPVIMGQQYAVSSMKHQATEAAVRILEAGGNAFDATVAGQAVLALVNPASNGFGSDAVILVYHAKTKKVSRSMPKERRRSWRRSIGTTRTTAARFPSVTDCFRRRFPA